MRKIIIIFAVFASWVITGCVKEEIPHPSPAIPTQYKNPLAGRDSLNDPI